LSVFQRDLATAGKIDPASRVLLGHRNLSTTARYLLIATSKVCATTSPLESLHAPAGRVPPHPPLR
jgi:integrase/recombinase XerD